MQKQKDLRNTFMQMEVLQMAELHKYLTPMDKYTKDLPFYVDNLFTDEELEELRQVINVNKYGLKPVIQGELEKQDEENMNRFRPKHIGVMSRTLIEFEMPKHIEEKLDLIAKPLYDGDIALCHYNYIEYSRKYSDDKRSPMLPPHIDADENLVTINYCMDGNVEWDLYVSEQDNSSSFKRYTLKPGQAIIFSAVNQIHWRPKRRMAEGEFLEILSMDWCPTTNYRFMNEPNPLDSQKNPQARKEYVDSLNMRSDFRAAWDLYNKDGIEDGIGMREEY